LRVHEEIERWVEQKPQTRTRLHRYTKQIMDALQTRRLRPVISEFPLLSLDGTYLTRSDLICQATRIGGSREHVVVSLKTGYNRSIYKAQGSCRGPCASLPNSQHTHHALQLACEVYVLEHEYGIRVGRALILYAGFGQAREVHVCELPRWGRQLVFMMRVHEHLKQRGPATTSDLLTLTCA